EATDNRQQTTDNRFFANISQKQKAPEGAFCGSVSEGPQRRVRRSRFDGTLAGAGFRFVAAAPAAAAPAAAMTAAMIAITSISAFLPARRVPAVYAPFCRGDAI
ncbi:MAG TPA: hypothetical protein VGE86_11990, partial [Thermoanaerobaculia bacterium]